MFNTAGNIKSEIPRLPPCVPKLLPCAVGCWTAAQRAAATTALIFCWQRWRPTAQQSTATGVGSLSPDLLSEIAQRAGVCVTTGTCWGDTYPAACRAPLQAIAVQACPPTASACCVWVCEGCTKWDEGEWVGGGHAAPAFSIMRSMLQSEAVHTQPLRRTCPAFAAQRGGRG